MFDGSLFDPINATKLRAIIWAGLLHEEEMLTVKEVGAWLSFDNMEEITEALTSFATQINPVADDTIKTKSKATSTNKARKKRPARAVA